jgi:SAM-dependent methyltransferase
MLRTSEAALSDSAALRSFRDPAGTLFRDGQRILRQVNGEAVAALESFLRTRTAQDAVERGTLVRSKRLSADLFEHERIPFPSYPYEWPAEMLYAAGKLTMQLARGALEEGFGIKDATPYNVLFHGSRAVFVDVLSFEPRDGRDAAWLAYGQFVRTFLLPLLAHQRLGMPLAPIFSGARDGLEPETVYRWSGTLQRFFPPFLTLVSIPKWLSGREKETTYRPRRAPSEEQALFILERVLRSCERQLDSLKPRACDSAWSGYLEHKSIYTASQRAQKEALVREALAIALPGEVLDIGANEGYFSFLAARERASVVAIDSDAACVGSIWRGASQEGLNVLPLVVDWARPTPAMGWRNRECASFLDRARGGFDLVMMLAVVHHLAVSERIPLEEIFALAAETTREYLLIEFVGSDDPCFRRIVRGRDQLYSHLTRESFEAAARERFDLVKSARIDGMERWIYLLRKRR